MASLLGKQLFEISGQGPPPSKDFFQLVISKDEVILTTWIISLRPGLRGVAPTTLRTSHDDFLQEKSLKEQVRHVFGQKILDYTISLCEGKWDYLARLSDEILLRVMSYLQLQDTTVLAQVSRRFKELCDSEAFWEQVVRNRCAEFTEDLEGLAYTMGWRKIFFTLFHTNGSEVKQK